MCIRDRGSLHTVVLLRTEVIAYNRLHSHRQPQYNHYIEYQLSLIHILNLDVKEGEFVAIMGPSGCGKSALLNILGLLGNPTEGSNKLLGQEVADLEEKERTRVRKGKLGFVFQSFNLIDELNLSLLHISWVKTLRPSKRRASLFF